MGPPDSCFVFLFDFHVDDLEQVKGQPKKGRSWVLEWRPLFPSLFCPHKYFAPSPSPSNHLLDIYSVHINIPHQSAFLSIIRPFKDWRAFKAFWAIYRPFKDWRARKVGIIPRIIFTHVIAIVVIPSRYMHQIGELYNSLH